MFLPQFSPPRLKVAILGATGIVGKELIRMLEKHPYFELNAEVAATLGGQI